MLILVLIEVKKKVDNKLILSQFEYTAVDSKSKSDDLSPLSCSSIIHAGALCDVFYRCPKCGSVEALIL